MSHDHRSQPEQNRIALAKAMDINFLVGELTDDLFGLPDPFTDANDDYAVLEWMREQWDTELIDAALEHTGLGHKSAYSIGDYAEAAIDILKGSIAACHKGGCEQFDAEDTDVNNQEKTE